MLEVGRIVMEDTCERLLEKEDIKEFYLGIKEAGRPRQAALEEAQDMAMSEDARERARWMAMTGGSRSTAATRCPSCSGIRCKARDERTALREKDLGIWRATTWREYGERARAVGMGLVQLGLKRGDVVSILAETVPEWLYADMGMMGAGGVTNGIYPTDSAKQVEYIVNDSRSRFLFVENEEQLDKFLEVRERCPTVAKVFVFDMEGLADFSDPMVMPLDELLALGREHDAAHPGRMGEARRGLRARGPGDAGLHLGHHRPAQGRDDLATATSSSSCATPTPSSRSAATTSSSPSCRSATSPSAPSPPSCRCAPAPSPTSPRASRRCRRTCARWRRPPSSPCRASGSASIPASPSA